MIRYFLLCFLFTGACGMTAVAQTGNKPKPAKAAPGKAPRSLKATWGIFLSDTLPRTEVIKLLDSSLVVRDEKNVKYPVTSFAFTYEHHESYLNDTTGQPGIYKDFKGDNFKSSRLPALWSSRLKEELQRGDVLYFDDIIIQYPGGKFYLVPGLKFEVK